jgi:hypothetical protein
MSKFWKIFIAVFVLLVLAVGIYYFFNYKKTEIAPLTTSEDLSTKYPAAATPLPDENTVRNWKIYSDPSNIFSLKYPDNIIVNGSREGAIQFQIEVKKISDLVADSKTAESNKELLDKGSVGNLPSDALDVSKKVISLDNGKVFSMGYLFMYSGNSCSIALKRELVFYYGENQIKISYDIVDLTKNLSEDYLATDKDCQTKIWKDETGFFKQISENNISGDLQTQYNDFDEIIKSIKIK